MAFVIADRVRESSITTGTGSIALGGAVIGYQTFDTVLDTGDTTYYTIADQGGTNWEVGIGTFTSPSTLARTTILSSSNGGSIVTFTAGTKDVFISLPASKTNTDDQPNVIAVNSTSDALRITQTGTGNALVVEDSTNPDATPFVVEANGRLIVGYTATVPSVGVSGTPQIGVFSGSTTNNGFANYSYTASTGASAFNFAKSRSTTFGTPSIVLASDDLGYIRFTGDDGAQFLEAARIWSEVDGTPGLNSMPGRLIFSTTPSGATSPVTRMIIGSTGNIGIGTAGTEPFTIRNLRNFSGATTAYGISQGGEIQSGVTTSVFVNHTAPTTQATAFTLAAVYHYSANSLTIGAGSAVTTQYGFFAGSGLTTALTNNYGFYSDIAAGTGRWNFYANGTADNYFAGDVGIGTSAPTARLNVVDATSQDAVRITQTGTGNALVIEDSTNPDATPFVVDAGGIVIVGTTVASSNIQDSTGVARSPQFQIQGNSVASAAGTIINWSSTINSPPAMYLAKSKSGTRGTQGIVASGDVAGLLQFNGDDGVNFVPAAAITAAIDGTPGLNDMPGRLVFSTTADGASTATERMRIDSSGQIKFGGTSLTNSFVSLQGTPTLTTTAGYALRNDVTFDANVSSAQIYGFGSTHAVGSTGSVTDAIGFFDATFATSGATVTNYYSFYASNQTVASTNYGFYSNILSGTGRWNFYAQGTADNYFNGNVGVGTTTLGSKLTVNGDVAGTFFVNPTTVSANYTVPTNYNAMTAGPITVNSGVVVTVGSGSVWTIV